MALAANLGFGPLIKKRRLLAGFHELMPVGGLFHHLMAGDTSQPAVRVGTRFPVSLNAALMATETSVVLDSCRLARVLAKGDHPANALATACGSMVAARAVTILAGSFFPLIARVEQENFPHHRLGKFFKGGRVASLTNFIADVGGGGWLRCSRFRRPNDSKENQQQ